jgi:hypothetical protein
MLRRAFARIFDALRCDALLIRGLFYHGSRLCGAA